MSDKNQIKIEGSEATQMRLNDIPDVLRLATKAQARFKVFSTGSPSTILREISMVLQKNFRNSVVIRAEDEILAAFVLRAETSISAELVYSFVSSEELLTAEMAEKFKKMLTKLGFLVINAKIQTSRRDLDPLLAFLKNVGFDEISNENDAFVSISIRIA